MASLTLLGLPLTLVLFEKSSIDVWVDVEFENMSLDLVLELFRPLDVGCESEEAETCSNSLAYLMFEGEGQCLRR